MTQRATARTARNPRGSTQRTKYAYRLVNVCVFALLATGCAGNSGDQDDVTSSTVGAASTTTTVAAPVLSTPSSVDETAALAVATVEVAISGFAFEPADITIAARSTVVWTNEDASPHTVTEASGLFDSGTLQRDQRFEHVFNTPGVYTYRCTFHAGMIGTVTVK
jgi:plastocyanin